MTILHCVQADLAIYVPAKCGTKLIEQIVDFPEFEGLFYISNEADDANRRNRIIIFRNHLDRILSVYYDKIVDPNFNDTVSPGWRKRGSKDPTGLGYHPQGYESFQTFLLNLAVNAECRIFHNFIPHILPYTTDTTAVAGLISTTEVATEMVWTHELKDLFIKTLLSSLSDGGIDRTWCRASIQERWMQLSVPHKINYSDSLPPPSEYGAESWSKVSWIKLFECFQDHGALPKRNVMYNDLCQAIVSSQIGYRLDNNEINRDIEPYNRHDLLSLRS
jgi:hypothetical protein